MSNGYSLHVGLNAVDPARYGGWSGELRACEYDARDMEALAKLCGYSKRRVLLTKDATSGRFIEEVLRLAHLLKEGDILLLSYSGHGGQIPDQTGEEDDGLDETWCLYDRQFIDDELYSLFGLFKAGVRILVLSDSCHSGTVTRLRIAAGLTDGVVAARNLARSTWGHTENDSADEARVRAAPLEITLEDFANNRDEYIALQAATAGAERRDPAAGVLLISGCMDNQESLDGSRNGLFTATLKRVWRDGAFEGGYGRFHQTIVSRMPPTQTPNLFKVGNVAAGFMNQKPFSV
jgi:metacaspase-1